MGERSLQDLLDVLAEAERLDREAEAARRLARKLTAGVAADLRRLRAEAGLTQGDVASALGVTKSYVSQVENEAPTSPTRYAMFAQSLEGGTHAEGKDRRRSAKEDLKKARGAKDD